MCQDYYLPEKCVGTDCNHVDDNRYLRRDNHGRGPKCLENYGVVVIDIYDKSGSLCCRNHVRWRWPNTGDWGENQPFYVPPGS